MVVTSSAAFDFARKLCDEFDRRKKDLMFQNWSLKQTVFQFLILEWVKTYSSVFFSCLCGCSASF